MRRYALALLCALLVMAVCLGCAVGGGENPPGPVLWFAGDTRQWSSTTTAVATEPYEGDMTAEGLMAALLAGPREGKLVSPIPEGTRLLRWSMREGTLFLDLSGEYGTLDGVDLTLADYCIAMTMEQLPGVEYVTVTVEGRPLPQRYSQELSGDGAVLSGAEEQPVEVTAALYFPRSVGRGLGFESRTFQLTEDDVLAEIVTRALLDGPRSNQLTSLLPEGTTLLSVQMEDGVCTVNFSPAFVNAMPQNEDSQTLIIYSLVDTLGNLDSVQSVVIQVSGTELERYGAVACGGGLEPDFGLVGGH